MHKTRWSLEFDMHICIITTISIRSTNQLYRRYVSIHRTVVISRRTKFYGWQNILQCRKCEKRSSASFLLVSTLLDRIHLIRQSCLRSDNFFRIAIATFWAYQEKKTSLWLCSSKYHWKRKYETSLLEHEVFMLKIDRIQSNANNAILYCFVLS